MEEEKFVIRDLRSKRKFFIDDFFIDIYGKLVGVYGISVYNVLCRHAGKSQIVFPGQSSIAEKINASEKQVGRVLKILENHKIISIEKKGKKMTNRYYLLDQSEWTVEPIIDTNSSEEPKILLLKYFFKLQNLNWKNYNKESSGYSSYLIDSTKLLNLAGSLDQAINIMEKLNAWAIKKKVDWGFNAAAKYAEKINILKKEEVKEEIKEKSNGIGKFKCWWLVKKHSEPTEEILAKAKKLNKKFFKENPTALHVPNSIYKANFK